jgi:hypothetical protein
MRPVTVACPRLLDEHDICEKDLQVTIGGDFGEEYLEEITGTCNHEFTEEENEAILTAAIVEVCDRARDQAEYRAEAAFDTIEERDMYQRDMRGE